MTSKTLSPSTHRAQQRPVGPIIGRRRFLRTTAAWTLGLAAMPRRALSQPRAARRPNVLLILADDLRPDLGCYGHAHIHSPHIDRLAAQSTLFQRAMCNVPVCGPSRLSILTGLRAGPDTWSTEGLDRGFISLPAHFKQHGYRTISNGKVFHHMRDRQEDWSEAPWRSVAIYHGRGDWAQYNTYLQWRDEASARFINPQTGRGPYCEAADVPDNAYQDGKLADKTIQDLRRLAQQDQPFFLACGFWRPHLPFNAPRRYWDLYDRDRIEPATNRFEPRDKPPALVSSTEIDSYARTGDRKADLAFHREARHAYHACISYVDAQIGRILEALEELGLADNTLVVLCADHGWNLGEHNFWGKHNTLHHSLHVPLIIRTPSRRTPQRSNALVELVDLYPTLCDLAGLPIPPHAEGVSIGPLLSDPDQPWKPAAFARWQHGCHAVKTDRYLYTQWLDAEGRPTQHMLFDHQLDPQENVNLADRAEARAIVEHHRDLLRRGWQAAWPTNAPRPPAAG